MYYPTNLEIIASQPKSNQILFEAHGFTVEMCLSPESLNAALATRYNAYYADGSIEYNEEGLFQDEFDEQINSRVFTVWQGSEPVGTIRNSIYSPKYNWNETLLVKYHKKDLNTYFKKQVSLIESSRFAVSPDITGKDSRIVQGILFRIQYLAQFDNDVEYFMTGVKPNHIEFYRRYMGFKPFDWTVEAFPFGGYLLEAECPVECSFPYSDYDFLKIDKAQVLERYIFLSESYRNFRIAMN